MAHKGERFVDVRWNIVSPTWRSISSLRGGGGGGGGGEMIDDTNINLCLLFLSPSLSLSLWLAPGLRDCVSCEKRDLTFISPSYPSLSRASTCGTHTSSVWQQAEPCSRGPRSLVLLTRWRGRGWANPLRSSRLLACGASRSGRSFRPSVLLDATGSSRPKMTSLCLAFSSCIMTNWPLESP